MKLNGMASVLHVEDIQITVSINITDRRQIVELKLKVDFNLSCRVFSKEDGTF
jgi:hypothetical protein